ncbi:hypothetical protein LINPERPRIM_LOCUS42102 [Linum perenne]
MNIFLLVMKVTKELEMMMNNYCGGARSRRDVVELHGFGGNAYVNAKIMEVWAFMTFVALILL